MQGLNHWPENDDDLHGFIENLRASPSSEIQTLLTVLDRYHGYRSRREHANHRPLPTHADLESLIPASLRESPYEWLGWIPIFADRKPGTWQSLSQGCETRVSFPLRKFFLDLLRLEPAGFYLFHNHPSQSLLPSLEDVRLTRKVGDLAKAFGIHLLGHGIVGIRQTHWMMIGSHPRGKLQIIRKRSTDQRLS